MGKDKGQRVKGNLKPASSGRTVDLIGSSTPITFTSLSSSTPGFVPLVPDSNETGLHPQITLTLRKLGKKDSTTKIKALTELIEISTKENEEEAGESSIAFGILPYWPKIYCRLVVDDSPKVRELSHLFLEHIGKKVGRGLGQHVKEIIPYLFLSTNDTHPLPASVAQNTFKSLIISDSKQKQALQISVIEIQNILRERLNSDSELLKITFLIGLNNLITIGIQLPEIITETTTKSDKFWKFPTDESSLVRRSFWILLGTLGDKEPGLIPKSKALVAFKTGFSNERLELVSLWNSFLILTLAGVIEEKSFGEKQILECCEKGFYGHASSLGPLLLPIVAKIKPTDTNSIFIALENGFELERSRLEKQCIVRVYGEIFSYLYKETNLIPESLFSFLSKDLQIMTKFGQTVSKLIQKSEFYTSFANSSSQRTELIQNPNFGIFCLSFLQNKPKVGFSDPEENTKQKSNCWDEVEEKDFIKTLGNCLLSIENYVGFLSLATHFSGSTFLQSIIQPQNIPNLFKFKGIGENKVKELRLCLELIKSFPSSPHSLSLLSTIHQQGFTSQQDLQILIKEIQQFDYIPQIKLWIKSYLFNDELINSTSSSSSQFITKYILTRPQIFGNEIIQKKIKELANRPKTHLKFILDFIRKEEKNSNVDLSEFFISLWDNYIQNKENEDGEENEEYFKEGLKIGEELLGFDFLKSMIMDEAKKGTSIEEIKRLGLILFNLNSDDGGTQLEFQNISTTIDPDLITFRGFGYNLIRRCELIQPNPISIRPILSECLYSAQILLDISSTSTFTLTTLNSDSNVYNIIGYNLLYVSTLLQLFPEYNELIPGIQDEIHQYLIRIIEKLGEDIGKWKRFCLNVIEKTEDCIWDSKEPLIKLRDLIERLELPFEGIYLPEPKLILDTSNIQKLRLKYRIQKYPTTQTLIQFLNEERKNNSTEFHFDEPFQLLPQQDKLKLISILQLGIDLLNDDEDFSSVFSCWISGWLKMCLEFQEDKIFYLWISTLSRGIVLLDKIGKSFQSFRDEYLEFHVQFLFPPIYTHFLRIVSLDEYWGKECLIWIGKGISIIPNNILLNLSPESSKTWELFTPILTHPSIHYKIPSHQILCKTILTQEILPKEFEIYSKRFKKNSESINSQLNLLLLWDSLLKSQPNGFELANYVKEQHLLPQVLNLIFNLLPEKGLGSLFADIQEPILNPWISNNNLSEWSVWILYSICNKLPNTVRYWWTNLGKQKDKTNVEKIIIKYLSSKLVKEELKKVELDWKEGDNVSINCHPGSNELIARYKIDETTITLKITLPLNHPLGSAQVTISDKKLVGRLTQLLNSRSHSLGAGLKLWTESLDNLYKDLDECCICFFIVHHQTRQIPKVSCKTCKKKFHTPCIYKWFHTSNKSECPLCRNIW